MLDKGKEKQESLWKFYKTNKDYDTLKYYYILRNCVLYDITTSES